MTEPQAYEAQVQEALAHLYDLSFLERAPLAASLGQPKRRGGGATLHRVLVEAIERLKPPRDVSAEAVAWKIYRTLHLRYVRSLSASVVASELGLSTRQAQRIHVAAVASVATALSEAQWTSPPDVPVQLTTPRPWADSAVLADPLLDDEIAAILAGEHGESESLPSILRSAVDTVTPMLGARQASVELLVDDAVAPRIAPHDLVRPAVVQLLLAALDWGPAQKVIVFGSAEGDNVRLLLAVESRAKLADVELGQTALDHRLRVAHRLLGALGGRVAIELAPAFRIEAWLPVEVAPTILVVEDNPQVVQLFHRYLSGSPFQLVAAANGSVAFDLATAEHPAAITLDLLLPQRDGWEFLQAVKVHPDTRHIPVIVCSVLRERELALALGAADFLAKPVTQHDLLSSLRRHVVRLPPFLRADSPRPVAG
jgi:CheY-like chemotaxis protein